MTVVREAIVLPAIFLSVVLAGGLRPAAPVVFAPPPMFSFVLATLLLALLVQSGTLDPRRVTDASRSALANTNGAVLLLSLFLAAAQVFALLTPTSGLPRALVSFYFLMQMLSVIAAGPDRVRALRSLLVTFSGALMLKFVVLDALSNAAGSRLGRALQLLLEGVTLGTVSQQALHPSAPYLAFLALALFLVGVWMLPAGDARRLRLESSVMPVRRD